MLDGQGQSAEPLQNVARHSWVMGGSEEEEMERRQREESRTEHPVGEVIAEVCFIGTEF